MKIAAVVLFGIVAFIVSPVLGNLLSSQLQPFVPIDLTSAFAIFGLLILCALVLSIPAIRQQQSNAKAPGRSPAEVDSTVGTTALNSVEGQMPSPRDTLAIVKAGANPRAEIPLPENILGRDATIDVMCQCLSESTGPKVIVIGGMSGVGKTQVAYLLASRLKLKYPSQILIRVPTGRSETLEGVLMHCVAAAEYSGGPVSIANLRATYYDRLRGSSTLILIDNLSDRVLLDELLPPPETCAIIVTSQIAISHTSCSTIVGPLSQEDATRLVIANATSLSADLANHIARLCGGHPLAIRVACAYLANHPNLDSAQFVDEMEKIGPIWRLQLNHLFEKAYDGLSAPLRTAIHRLMVLQAPFELQVGAYICDTQTGASAVIELAANHLIDRGEVTGRFSIHELVRDYVRRRTYASLDADGAGALDRLIEYGARTLYQKYNEWDGSDKSLSRDALRYFDSHRELLLDALSAASLRNNGSAYLIMARGLSAFAFQRLSSTDRIRIFAKMLEFAGGAGHYGPQLDALYELGQAYWTELKPSDAITNLEEGLRIAEASADPKYVARFSNLLSQMYFLLGDKHRSESLIVDGAANDTQIGIAATVNRARLASADGMHEQALAMLLEVLRDSAITKLDSDTAQLNREIGHAYVARREMSKAREYYLVALAVCNESGLARLAGQLHLDLAASWEQDDDYEMALVHARQAEACFPEALDDQKRATRAVIDVLQQNAPPWILESDPKKRAMSYCQFGHYASQHNDLYVARNAYNVALRIDPTCCEAIGGLGWTLHLLHDDLRALELVGKAVVCDPLNVNHQNNLAAIQLDSGQYAEAITSAKSAIRLDVTFGSAYLNCGLALLKLGQRPDAISCLEEGIRYSAPFANLYYNLGVLRSQDGRAGDAATCYEKAIWCDPDYVNAIYNLGVLRLKVGKLNEAANLFRRVLELMPTHEGAEGNLSQLLEFHSELA